MEFISSLKWPITVLILAVGAYWTVKRNQGLKVELKQFLATRNVRAVVGGQELEFTHAEAAVALAAQPDEHLMRLEEESGVRTLATTSEVTRLRRGAIEGIMRDAAVWGWRVGRTGSERPPNPVIRWTEDGVPEIHTSPEQAEAETRGRDEEVFEKIFSQFKTQRPAWEGDPDTP
ncbi:hypothetical protein [Streptomyces pseudovenezuelae]|uniref:hypothetical protein n=1 Tax=Streptomyces pseudovenezuelae TaxID=67350 RepID=UPI00247338E3|nr:hypothetical protein [Streptomyces pseudovenezuelae]